jgi:hypothetical protein
MLLGGCGEFMNKGLVNVDRVILEAELRDYLSRIEAPDKILSEVVALHGKCQILEWESPADHKYRFFIQQLDDDNEPLLEVTHPLTLKECTYNNGN